MQSINPLKKRTKYSPKDFSQTNPPFAKSYIAFLNAYNWQGGEYFYNGEDSFVTFTEGIDRPALKAFYDVIEGEYSMGGHIYGFLKNPRNIVGDDYTSIVDFLSKDKHDILMLLVYSHVDLHINLNSEQFDEENVIRIIQEVCKKDGKNLHGVDD